MPEYATFKEWLVETLGPQDDNDDTGCLSDLVIHGAITGFPGLTYYNETATLYEKYTDELWYILCNTARYLDYRSPLLLVVAYSRGAACESDIQFKNQVVWIAAETVAADFLSKKKRGW